MKKLTSIIATAALGMAAFTANAGERADVYVVKFRSDNCSECSILESNLDRAMAMAGTSKAKIVNIDTTNALTWEVSAHRAFDANIVPVYNKWVGKTGFVAVVDAKSRRAIGCFDAKEDVYKMANFVKSAAGLPHDRAVANRNDFRCPAAQNVDTGK